VNSANRERVKELLSRAARLPPQDRAAFIRRAAGDDHQTAAEALDLLSTLDDSAFMSAPTGAGMAAALPNAGIPGEGPGTRIDRYKLLQLIGEGGFGSVYMAEQTAPVHRRVALKIIKAGMDTKQVIARFEAERQALAMMDHPNIARVLDAGATDAGRPYFVMELVRGEPVTAYCDRERLPVGQRLDLFRDVCSAVQHAHQKGIIHRDLKPTNVLVTVADGQPVPKVIDFGIAKATAARLTDKTLFTEMHQLIGTPEYMSPEQAEVSGVDIDTRSDVYALGVLLYELLAGSTPLERGRLRSTPLAEIQRLIREEEPPRPSLRLATLPSSGAGRFRTPPFAAGGSADSSAIEIARCRRSEPSMLTKALRGDLDWIVMKCLEKDRQRRYATASALAEDVGRYLLDQPVVATPASRGYRLRKFTRRNRTAVLAGAGVTMALLIATGVSIAFALSEATARDRERSALAREIEQRELASREAGQARALADFQSQMLADVDLRAMGDKLKADLLTKARAAPKRDGQNTEERDERVRELEKLLTGIDFTGLALTALDESVFQRALTAIEKQFAHQPVVKAMLLQSLADTLLEVGLLEAAIGPQTEALSVRRQELGDEHADTFSSIAAMGVLLRARGNLAEAEPYYREAMEKRRLALGDEHVDTLSSVHNMGALLQARGKLKEAEPFYREALEKRRRILGEEHRDTLTSMSSVGYLLGAQGKWAQAAPIDREVLEKRRRVLGDEHPHTLFSINNMGAQLQTQRKFNEAEKLYTEALEKRRRLLGDEHPDTLQSINNMGNLLEAQRKYAEAEPYYREALEKRRRVLGDEHPHTLNSISNMGTLLQSLGKLSEAEAYTREALEKRRRLLGNNHPDTLISINNMGVLLDKLGKLAEPEPYYREALERGRRLSGDDDVNSFNTMMSLSSLLESRGEHAEAVELMAAGEPTAREKFTAGGYWQLGLFLSALGRARTNIGDYETAQLNLTEAFTILGGVGDATDEDRREALNCLVKLYEAWHAAEPDRGFDSKSAEWRAKLVDLQSGQH